MLSAKQILALATPAEQLAWLEKRSRAELEGIMRGDWWWTGRPEQFAPEGNWLVWLILSGRGWGKSRTGSEWLIDRAMRHPKDRDGNRTEWLVIAETLNDCRTICIEGNSGLLATLRRLKIQFKYQKAPRPVIHLPQGQVIYFEGADDENVGRGYNAAGAWLDELAKWKYTYNAWLEGIMPSLRAPLVGDHPRAVVTTTPKPIKLILDWAHNNDGTIRVTRGSTFDNRANLSPYVLAEMERNYLGTRMGRQELLGELLEDIEGALWSRAQIEQDRVKHLPELVNTVVGMDPAGTGAGDETGLIAVGRGVMPDHDYVLEDWSKQISGHAAARRAWELFRHVNASLLIIEDNIAKKWLYTVVVDAYKEMQEAGLFSPGGSPPVKMVTARAGKRLRAEPIASRYEQHRVHHVGHNFTQLEDQMCLVAGTLVETDRGQVPIEQVTTVDRVMTRAGWAPLRWAGCTGAAHELVFTSYVHGCVVSTPCHPIFNPKIGLFVPAGHVEPGHPLAVSPRWVNTDHPLPGADGGTTACPPVTIATLRENSCTEPSGKPTTDLWGRGYSCITSTNAQEITGWKILSPSPPANTESIIPDGAGLGRLPSSVRRPAAPPGQRPFPAPESAPGATASTTPPASAPSFAVQDVGRRVTTTPVSVYNLTVADGFPSEFYANGVLVHNCTWEPEESTDSPDRVDALVYAGLELQGRERRHMTVAAPGEEPLISSAVMGGGGFSFDPYGSTG